MKAITLSKSGEIKYKEVLKPKIKPSWANIRVMATGLCGSDIQKIFTDIKSRKKLTTEILGHEFSGLIEEIGPNDFFKKRERVAIMPILFDEKRGITNSLSLGKDLPGGFAEYCLVPIQNLRKIPNNLSFDLASLADVVAVSIHGYNLCMCPQKKDILVLGDGPVALSTAILLNLQRNNVFIVGKNSKNLEIARKMGIKVINNTDVREKSFDFVFECVGRHQDETIKKAIFAIKPLGKIVVLGVFKRDSMNKLCLRNLFFKEASLIGSNSYICDKFSDDFLEALKVISLNKSKFSKLITHVFPLFKFQEGLGKVSMRKKTGVIKLIFHP